MSEISRVTKPGRLSAVHCMDIPNPGQRDGYHDLPGRIIKIHEDNGFYFFGRIMIWKEPLRVAIRTRLKHLTHKQLVKDSAGCTVAAGDMLLIFKKKGENLEFYLILPLGRSAWLADTVPNTQEERDA